MFAMMMGAVPAKPAGVSGTQWEDETQVNFTAPGVVSTIRVERETAPGSGVWNSAAAPSTVTASQTSVFVAGYTQNDSYRVRFERQGVASDWATFSTPAAALGFPSAPVSVLCQSISGVQLQGDITPSEPNCLTRYQFRTDILVVTAEATVATNGVPSPLGPFFTPQISTPARFRARHERFSGTGPWASAWVEDIT